MRARRFLTILFCSVIGVFGMAFAAEPPKDLADLRILSYNIRHGEGMDGKVDLQRIAAVIAKAKPDIVALQEVDKHCQRSGNQDIAAELGRLLGMEHRFAKFMDFQGGEYGMAVLSRLPIKDSIRHPLPEGSEPRCALEISVQADQWPTPVSVVCIHHDWVDEKIRGQQVTQLLRALGPGNRPIILAGDFNGTRGDSSLKLLQDKQWTILEKTQGAAPTFPSDNPTTEIDFFVTRNLPATHVDHFVIEETEASDHRPIFAVFQIRENTDAHHDL